MIKEDKLWRNSFHFYVFCKNIFSLRPSCFIIFSFITFPQAWDDFRCVDRPIDLRPPFDRRRRDWWIGISRDWNIRFKIHMKYIIYDITWSHMIMIILDDHIRFKYDCVEILGGAGKRFTMQNWTLENPALQSMHSLQRWPTLERMEMWKRWFPGISFHMAPFSAFMFVFKVISKMV